MSSMSAASRFEHLFRVGVELSAEKDRHRLVERILLAAKDFCRADGGTLYLYDDKEDCLRFELLRTDSLGLAFGGSTGQAVPLDAVPMHVGGAPNHANVASHCGLMKASINVADAYEAEGFDFAGTKAFDAKSGYRSQSFLTIPMVNAEDRLIGVLQLINAQDDAGEVVPFDKENQEVVEALAGQAAVALDNLILLQQQKSLLKAFIRLIAGAIDAKSKYTGGHCRRVPELTEMLAAAVIREDQGPLADFDMDDEEWEELHIAAWLHDCGKVTTPVHVMDKATKLETIYDRIDLVRARVAAIRQAILREGAERRLAGESSESVDADVEQRLQALRSDLDFLEAKNRGSEFMDAASQARVEAVGHRSWEDATGSRQPLLTENERYNLQVPKGTLTREERIEINGHMVQTIRMLQKLPFPRNLRNVPEYAGGHHEKMNGQGYPKGIFAQDMSVPARVMAIADVFEALTAPDRPYKPGMPLSQAMRIMGEMKRDNHLDPDLFDIFVRRGVYRDYADKHVASEQIDEVDEAALLAIEPRGFELPSSEERKKRWTGFLPEYEAMFPEPETPD